jgi:hypothetical protein
MADTLQHDYEETVPVVGGRTVIVRATKVGGGAVGKRWDGDWIAEVEEGGEVKVRRLMFSHRARTHKEVASRALLDMLEAERG